MQEKPTSSIPAGTEANKAPQPETVYDQPWANSLLRPFLISTMIACMIVAIMAFMRYALSGIPLLFTGAIIILGIVGALTGCLSTTLLAQPGQRMRRGTGLRVAEILLLLSLIRLASWATVGNWPTTNQILTRPVDSLFDAPFVVSSIIVCAGWMLASAMTSDFLNMGLQPDELYAAQQRTGRSTDDPTPPNYTDRRGVLRGFTNKWITGALFMVLLAAGTQLAPAQNGLFAIGRQNIDPAVITAVILYMLIGLILLSQGQLAVLRARWTLNKIPNSDSILRNWPIYTTLLIIGVGILATFLPFGDTFYLALIISTIIDYISTALMFIMQIILAIFLLIGSLFGSEPEESVAETPLAPQPLLPPQMAPPAQEAGFPPWLGGSIFWVIMACLLGYATYIYFGGRGANLNWLRQFWLMLRARWSDLFSAYQTWQQNRQTEDDAQKKPQESERSLFSRLTGRTRWQDLPPHQQTRYFYLNMLERAQKAGIQRNKSETPLQYAPRLAQTLDQNETDVDKTKVDKTEVDKTEVDKTEVDKTEVDKIEVDKIEVDKIEVDEESGVQIIESAPSNEADSIVHTLTEAFVRTRYAEQPVSTTEAAGLKNIWDQISKRINKHR